MKQAEIEADCEAEAGRAGASRAAKGSDTRPGRKVQLLTLADLDGRTRAAAIVRETQAAICSDLGGEARLSTLQRMAVANVALTAAMLTDLHARYLRGEAVEASVVATLSNTLNRTAAALGWQRQARDVTPSLQSYLRDRYGTHTPGGAQ